MLSLIVSTMVSSREIRNVVVKIDNPLFKFSDSLFS